eukprot:2321849-Prymnesium_polylepis.1
MRRSRMPRQRRRPGFTTHARSRDAPPPLASETVRRTRRHFECGMPRVVVTHNVGYQRART